MSLSIRLRRLADTPVARFLRDSALSGLRLLVGGLALGLLMSTLATLLARHWWAFDLTTHFRAHYVAVALVGVPLAAALRWRAVAVAIAVLAIPHAIALSSVIPFGTTQAVAAAPATPVRVSTINAYWANWDGDALLGYVAETDPDILVIQEADRRWRDTLLAIGARFPHAVPQDWREARDVIVFSRFPITGGARRFPEGQGFHYQTADLDVAGRTVTLIGVHPPLPAGPRFTAMRNGYFAAIAEIAAATDHPVIVAGDFNSTVWSPHFADLTEAAGLRNAADGRGWHPTWPSWLPLAGIPIDHILVSDDVLVHAVHRGPHIGSDHYPVTADLALR